jgi:hypothetical protein
MSDTMLERVAQAIEEAQCRHREGPFGLYDYSSYGDPIPHHVRDFRQLGSPTYGHCVFRSDDREAAQSEYDRLTRDYVARSAIEAMRDPTFEMMQAMHEAMFVDKWDASQAPMIGAGLDAAINAALSEAQSTGEKK